MPTYHTLVTASCIVWCLYPVSVTLGFKIYHNEGEYLSNRTPSIIFSSKPLLFPGQSSSSDSIDKPSSDTTNGEGDSVVFPGYLNDNITIISPTSECNYDNMTVSYNGTYWKLLTRGHCGEGEWTVMTEECYPQCQQQPCPKGYLEYQGQCVDVLDSSVCGEGQILYLDQRGSTYCDCEQGHFYFPWSSKCYARRQQGHCDFGFFLDINEEGNVDCMPNACLMEGFEMDPKTGKCLQKDFVGYCPTDQLDFHHSNRTVGCLLLNIRTLFDTPIARSCTPGSRLSHIGDCRVVIPSVTSLPRSLTSGCGRGSIRVGNGPCRRYNNYLG